MTSLAFDHQPVLLNEVVALIAPRPGQVMLDGTIGGGGHAAALLEHLIPGGHLYGLDQDPEALAAASHRLAPFGDHVDLRRGNFDRLDLQQFPPLDGIILDLGVSSPQLDHAERGFSFQKAGPLDMRMAPDNPVTAATLLAEGDEEELARIFFEYGEERFSRKVARAIVRRREERGPFLDTSELADFLRAIVPRDVAGIHSATRVFQALRIAVNDELGALERALPRAVEALAPGGRLAVISFHSLEDRMVKHFFRRHAQSCICPPRQPICTCQHRATLEIVTSKPVVAGEDELICNPRARSAKLRVARRLPRFDGNAAKSGAVTP